MKKITKASLIFLIAFFSTSSVILAEKKETSNAKNDKVKEIKDYEKPTAGKSNSDIYKEKISGVASSLSEIVEVDEKEKQNREEKTKEVKTNNPAIGKQTESKIKTREEIVKEFKNIAEQTESNGETTVKAIEKVENQNNFKKFLIGSDYKNLGQLRSSLVQNRNQIRQLTQTAEDVVDEDLKVAIQEQLEVLMGERERIKNIISENEEGFSLLGWAFRFMNNYENNAVDEQEELELEKEVLEAIETIDTAETVEAVDETAESIQ